MLYTGRNHKLVRKDQFMRIASALTAAVAGAMIIGAIPAAAQTSKADRTAAAQARYDAKLAKALEGRIAGEPVRCIDLRSIRSSTIIDRTAIIYEVGNKLYLNRPAGGATSLDSDDVLVTRTSSSQLCDIDIVRLIDRSNHFPTGFVSLGKFGPYSKVAKAS